MGGAGCAPRLFSQVRSRWAGYGVSGAEPAGGNWWAPTSITYPGRRGRSPRSWGAGQNPVAPPPGLSSPGAVTHGTGTAPDLLVGYVRGQWTIEMPKEPFMTSTKDFADTLVAGVATAPTARSGSVRQGQSCSMRSSAGV